MGKKRDKRRTKGPNIDNALQGDGSGDGREDVIGERQGLQHGSV